MNYKLSGVIASVIALFLITSCSNPVSQQSLGDQDQIETAANTSAINAAYSYFKDRGTYGVMLYENGGLRGKRHACETNESYKTFHLKDFGWDKKVSSLYVHWCNAQVVYSAPGGRYKTQKVYAQGKWVDVPILWEGSNDKIFDITVNY